MTIPTLIAMAAWLLTVKLSKLSSLGALLSIFLLTSYELIFIYGNLNKGIILLVFLLIFLKHFSNIKRLIKGEENKIDL
jgi:glycerol-3-phosphate acyltransferase PlsY